MIKDLWRRLGHRYAVGSGRFSLAGDLHRSSPMIDTSYCAETVCALTMCNVVLFFWGSFPHCGDWVRKDYPGAAERVHASLVLTTCGRAGCRSRTLLTESTSL